MLAVYGVPASPDTLSILSCRILLLDEATILVCTISNRPRRRIDLGIF